MQLSKRGFTLVEIILVMAIVLILAAMVVPNLSGRKGQAQRSAAQVDIETNLPAALDLYEIDNGFYPSTDQGLKALIVKSSSSPVPQNWNGPYLKKKSIPSDPWGQNYVYVSPGANNTEEFDLYSLGADGVESDDDIVNWGELE